VIEHDADELPAGVDALAREFSAFFADEYRRLFQALVLISGDRFEADDVAQESFVRVFERWDRVANMESPVAYLYRTALNEHRSRVRRRLRWARRSLFVRQRDDGVSDAAVARAEIARGLAMLTEDQRVALVLVEFAGMTPTEAGAALDVDAASIRARIYRARTKLREEWNADE
jgi:RNA polymerase sigma-70 factor (ECF subfamily)